MWQWLRRRFLTGLVVMVPTIVSVVALLWLFRLVDRLTRGLSESIFGRSDTVAAVVVTAGVVLLIGLLGIIATNVIGRRLLQRGDALLMHVPVFRTIYSPVKQLIAAFAPGNESGFKRVALVEDAAGTCALGFVTKEFTVDRGHGPEPFVAVYIPTNNLYLGDVRVYRPEQVSFPDLTVEEGVRVFLTGGMTMPAHVTSAPRPGEKHIGESEH
jgi:uncharacterized membrane protein